MTIWLSTSALTTAMQTFGLLWFCSWLFPERLALPRNIFLKALLFLFADMAVCLCIYLATRLFPDQGMVYAFVCTLLFQFAACQILFEGSGFFKFFNLLFANVYFTGVLMVSLFAADKFAPLRVHRSILLYAVYINVLPQLAAILALIPLFRRAVRTRFKTSPPRYYWLYACLIYLALYFGLMYTIDALPRRGNAQALSILLEAVLLLMSVVFYLMFLSICDGYHEKIRHSLIEQQVQLQKAHLTESQPAGKALKELQKKAPAGILLQYRQAQISVNPLKVIYIESNLKNQVIHLTDSTLEINYRLKDLEPLFVPHGFIKPHNSYLVNYRFISSIQTRDVLLDNGKALPVSKHRLGEFKKAYLTLISE